jgi:hypothetical protein
LEQGTGQKVIACRTQIQVQSGVKMDLMGNDGGFSRVVALWLWASNVPTVLGTSTKASGDAGARDSGSGHALLAYAADPSGIWVYDPNHPGEEVFLSEAATGQFQASSQTDPGVNELWTVIALAVPQHNAELEQTLSDAKLKFHGHAEAVFLDDSQSPAKELKASVTLPSGPPQALNLSGQIGNGNVIIEEACFTSAANGVEVCGLAERSFSVSVPVNEGKNVIPIRVRYWNPEKKALDDAYVTSLASGTPDKSTSLTAIWCPAGKMWNGSACGKSVDCNKGAFEGNFVVLGSDALAQLRPYTSVSGDLHIQYMDDDGLPCLQSVGGGLVFASSQTSTLKGLSSLTSAGELTVTSADGIKTLEGLAGLSSTGALRIYGNPGLESFDGLGVKEVTGDVWLKANDKIYSLSGLALRSIGGDLSISGNKVLLDLDALKSLTSLRGKLELIDNPRLYSLYGLEGLTQVLSLTIGNCPHLGNLSGLGLREVGEGQDGNVFIYQCPLLDSLAGLEQLVVIRNNLLLSDLPALASLSALAQLTTVWSVQFTNTPKLTCTEKCALFSHIKSSTGGVPSCNATCQGCDCGG